MRIPTFVRALSRRAAWILPFAAAIALPEACSEDSAGPPKAGATEAPPAIDASAEARARIQSIRAQFPVALGPGAGDVRFEAMPDGRIRASLPSTAPRAATVELPLRAGEPVRLTDDASGLSVSFALEGAAKAALGAADGLAIYAGAAPSGGDILHRIGPTGTEDFIFFAEEPPHQELRYRVDVRGAAGLRLVERTLEFLDRGGAPRLRVAPPYILGQGGARRELALTVEGCAVDTSPRAPWGRPVTEPGAPWCSVKVDLRGAGVRYPALVDPVWGATVTAMNAARTRHSITLLNPTDPKSLALIAGGFAATGVTPLKSAELYHPLDRTFATTGSMGVARGAHTATLLTKVVPPAQFIPPQPVLIAGGSDAAGAPLDSLEVYDPASGTFVADAQKMTTYPRFDHTATLFDDDKVLLAGGITLPLNQPTNTAYVYAFTSFVPGNPAPVGVNSTLIDASSLMKSARSGHAAVRIGTGEVLLAGGFVLAGGPLQALQSAELFDPMTSTFALTAKDMSVQRGYHTATLLNNGMVLIAGGLSKTVGGIYANTIDLFADGTQGGTKGFVTQPIPITMATGRSNHSATLLTTGDVLIAGGFTGPSGSAISAEEIFSPSKKAFTPLNALVPMVARGDHAALLINAGDALDAGRTVLVTGGSTSSTLGAAALSSAQILLKINGDACSQDDECLSGHCADVSNLANPTAGKMCCDTTCNEVCKSCSSKGKGGGADGVCGFTSNTTPLGWICKPTVGQEVEILEGCDGLGNVTVFASNKCTPNTCEGNRCGTECPCSDAGFCTDAGVEAGPDPDAGGGGAGGGGAGGGAGGSSGIHCEDRRPSGLACTEGRQCNSGYCVDGYCCNVPCTGQCEACDVVNKYGVCSNVGSPTKPEAPHVNGGSIDFNGTLTKREPCDGEGGGCVGFCEGADPLSCIYPGSKPQNQKEPKPPSCAADGDGFATTSYGCDGKGGEVSTPSSCAGFRCESPTACKTSCASDADCITDFVCLPASGGISTCQSLTGPLCDGDRTLRRPSKDGGNKQCDDHLACPAGSTDCLHACASVNDCRDNLVCNGEHRCVAPLAPPAVPSCSCAAVGEGRGGSPWALALAALCLGAIRRRRRDER